jgi:hypothetical protein
MYTDIQRVKRIRSIDGRTADGRRIEKGTFEPPDRPTVRRIGRQTKKSILKGNDKYD